MMKVYLKTCKGTGKSASDDRILVGSDVFAEAESTVLINCGCIAIADGVGGNRAGDVAAEMVCRAVSDSLILDSSCFSEINRQLVEQGMQNESCRDMATTLSGIQYSECGAILLFHVGNTRIYSIQAKKYLSQITEDDTVVNYLVRCGKLTEEEAASYPNRNEITACFGGGKENLLRMTLSRLPAHDFTHILITSDGIHEYLSIDDMEDIFMDAEGDWTKAINTLITNAVANGSSDDCSALIVDFTVEEESHGLEI